MLLRFVIGPHGMQWPRTPSAIRSSLFSAWRSAIRDPQFTRFAARSPASEHASDAMQKINPNHDR